MNLTAVLWPGQVGTVTYIWWIGNNTEVQRTQEIHHFSQYFSSSFAHLRLSRLLALLVQNVRIIILWSYFCACRLENV